MRIFWRIFLFFSAYLPIWHFQLYAEMLPEAKNAAENPPAAQKADKSKPSSDGGKSAVAQKKSGRSESRDKLRENKAAAREASKKRDAQAKNNAQNVREPLSPYETDSAEFVVANKIDEIVLRNLKLRGLKPAKLSSDAVFLRRVYIDATGTVPDEQKARAFLADKAGDKRGKLIESLLNSEAYALRMTQRFGDMLKIKAEFPINLWPNAAQAYSRFILDSFRKNIPYDVTVRKILTSEGSNFRAGEVNFFRAMQAKNPQSVAASATLAFMGIRYEKLSEVAKGNMAAFFERIAYKSTKEWKEEIVFNDPSKRAPFVGFYPDGNPVTLSPSEDPRGAFANWLTKKGNPYFSRAIANRMWYWLFGQPIVSPVDEMFASNPPANGELLDYLAGYLEASNFDLKKLASLILNSRIYQQSPIPQCRPEDAKKYFAVYPTRRIDAEALIDIICKLTSTAEVYESTTPEPYTKFPAGESAVALPDGSITTSFLELFGRPSRDTGLDSERVNAPSASQKLHMINSFHIRTKLENGSSMQALYRRGGLKFLEGAYLTIYSRYPTSSECGRFQLLWEKRAKRDKHWNHYIDTAWALLNSEEFVNNH